MENLLRDGIQPRIFGIHIKPIILENGKYAVVIRIPRSWSLPHMVTLQNHFKFYSRNSAGKYPLDVSELRKLFSLSGELTERIKNFHHERLSTIVAGETPYTLASDSFIALHIIPFSAFEPSETVDLPAIMRLNPRPMSSSGWNNRYNYDGVLVYTPIREGGKCSGYTQIFRSGIIEAVTTKLLRSVVANDVVDHKIPTSVVENVILTSTAEYLNILNKVNIMLPYSILISLINIRGYKLTSQYAFSDDDSPIDKDNLILPEILVMERRDNDIAPLFKQAFDAMWNAGGIPNSPNFKEDGTWRV